LITVRLVSELKSSTSIETTLNGNNIVFASNETKKIQFLIELMIK
jgi:hypothetical protein